MATETAERAAHPYDPLSIPEIERTRAILEDERDVGDDTRYIEIVLDEPRKEAVREYEGADEGIERRAFVILRDAAAKTTYEATVSLEEESVVAWEERPGVQPAITLEEFDACEETVKANEEWREAAAKRGVEDFDLAIVDPWSAGYHLVPDGVDRDRRLAHAMSWVRTSEEDNGYARPMDGLHVWVDLDEMVVVEVLDRGQKVENVYEDLEDAPYREDERELRGDLKPYNVDQPDGPSWSVDGRKVEWQNWHLRVGWIQREGLVLYDVGYEDDGTVRKILDRASLAEMAVPYGDRDPNHNWKNAWDVGEYNVGKLANSLAEGCDCLGYMHYFDAVMNGLPAPPRNSHSSHRTGKLCCYGNLRLINN